MLVRTVICIDDEETKTRLRRILRTCADTFVETARKSREPLWGRIARYAGDVAFVSRSLVPEPAPQSVEMMSGIPGAPRLAVLSPYPDSEDEARLVASGALAFLDLSIDDGLLAQSLEGLFARVRQERSDGLLLERELDTPQLSDFVTYSTSMQAFMGVVERVVESDATLLVTGETGVGKERLARAIHAASPRSRGPFIAVNCGALPESLLESELFGHTPGSFTGAVRARRGWFELAHRGTILLDEIGEMPLHLQTRLLRVLQDREVLPIGAEQSIPIDVRIVSATNRDLRALLEARRLREDLYYRLSVVTLEIPPLRERREDIRSLVGRYVAFFQARMATSVERFSEDSLAAMEGYSWPGNIRELVNVVERSMLLCPKCTVELDDLPGWLGGLNSPPSSPPPSPGALPAPRLGDQWAEHPYRVARQEVLDAFEKQYFAEVLRLSGGRIGEAAKRAGMTTRNLFDKLKRLGIDKSQFKY